MQFSFGPDPDAKARRELSRLRLGQGSLKDYNFNFFDIMKNIRDMGTQDQIAAYLRGLPTRVRKCVFFQKLGDIHDAVSVAAAAFENLKEEFDFKEASIGMAPLARVQECRVSETFSGKAQGGPAKEPPSLARNRRTRKDNGLTQKN